MKFRVVLFISIIIAVCAGWYALSYLKKTEQNYTPETVNAVINSETVTIHSEANGKIKFTTINKVSKGQLIAEIETTFTETIKQPQSKTNTEEDYQNAAIMYKDGVISKEEYDKKVDDISSSKPAENKKSIVKITKIYAPIDGEFVPTNIKSGDNVQKNEIIGNINSSAKEITAYFAVSTQNLIKIGSKATISIIKYPEQKFEGTVTNIDPPNLHGLPVKIKFNKNIEELNLNNGDSVVVTLL